MHSSSFESPDIGAIRFSLKKSLAALLRYFFHSMYLYFNIVFSLSVPFLTSIAVSGLLFRDLLRTKNMQARFIPKQHHFCNQKCLNKFLQKRFWIFLMLFSEMKQKRFLRRGENFLLELKAMAERGKFIRV